MHVTLRGTTQVFDVVVTVVVNRVKKWRTLHSLSRPFYGRKRGTDEGRICASRARKMLPTRRKKWL